MTSNTIVFIDHHDNLQDDLAWTHVGKLGFDRQLIRPFMGDVLPDPNQAVAGVVIYGGSQNVGEQDQYPFLTEELAWIETCMRNNIALLGICLGGQLIAHALGASVTPRYPEECEFGYYRIEPTSEVQTWLTEPLTVTQAHFEEFGLPETATRLASSERYQNQGFCVGDNILGLQFHPEVTPDIFRRWQDADWAMFDIPGSQTRDQQSALMNIHASSQAQWFEATLDRLFGSPAA